MVGMEIVADVHTAEQSGNVLDQLSKAAGGKSEPLWQDNWDDDDIEDDFTKQLRYVNYAPFVRSRRYHQSFWEYLRD